MGDNNHIHILLVDDEPLVRRSLSEFLTLEGYSVATATNGVEALQSLNGYTPDIVITDIKMPQMDGVEFLRNVKLKYPEMPVILITGYGSIGSAVDAMKEGAYDYITKPIVDNEIKIVLERLANQRKIIEENIELRERLAQSERERFISIVGKDIKMQKIYSLIEAVARTRATVLISGESGTGKHLIAHAIHDFDPEEKKKPFIEVSCGALTETLLESELFGHVKGAFTGAIKDKPGRFELADGGTIFLDEIDAFSPNLQVKLLRILQEGELERVGDSRTIKVDVRVVAATNHNLEELIEQKKFRKDLYYRLKIIDIEVPPLRERKGDIPLLIRDLIEKHSKHLCKKVEAISEEFISQLIEHDWPGNVRELENVIERAIILSQCNELRLEHLPDFLRLRQAKLPEPVEVGAAGGNGNTLKDALKNPEREIIVKTLDSVGWNRNDAAKALGINRTTLYKKMVRYELIKPANGRRATGD